MELVGRFELVVPSEEETGPVEDDSSVELMFTADVAVWAVDTVVLAAVDVELCLGTDVAVMSVLWVWEIFG